MADLLLDSLEISNFRAFEHLKIERLGRVNLIVGQNSVGKTSLLEALWLYANQGSFLSVVKILRGRKEISQSSVKNLIIEDEEAILEGFKYLIYGRQDFTSKITIGSAYDNQKGITLEISKNNSSIINSPSNYTFTVDSKNQDSFKVYGLARGNHVNSIEFEDEKTANIYIPVNGLTESEVNELWGRIILTNFENDIVKALRIIVPKIERIAVISGPGGYLDDRSVFVRIEGIESRLPLRSLGDGLNRIFGIALALVNSKDGMLLVDEIENGLHFSVQLELWRLIFAIASRLNVQVFATTHSWDCLEAFQQAANEDPELGMVIRLNNIEGEITPTAFDERRLAIATREQIEVR